jgi:E3 ubiquitin-protein ligase LRSAM1
LAHALSRSMGSSVSCLKNGVAPGENKDNEMNWFRRDSSEKVNYKARLEHKQMMAQSNPEPVYDLIDCGLKTVPASAFSHCRIQRKEVLLLQDNELTSLGSASLSDLKDIKVLDLHNNGLEKLPDDIKHLEKLEVLYLQNNKLKQLPSSIGALRNLKTLNLSHNRLKDLPAAVSGCVSLRTLDLRNNPKLKQIPKEIAHIRCLETLLLDEENITFPDVQTAKQGTEAIMRVLCKGIL